MSAASASETLLFRSILPHEPLPKDGLGYLNIQGALSIKQKRKNDNEKSTVKENNNNNNEEIAKDIAQVLKKVLSNNESTGQNEERIVFPHSVTSVYVYPCLTKALLLYENQKFARDMVIFFKAYKITPSDIFQNSQLYSSKPLQSHQLVVIGNKKDDCDDNANVPLPRWNYSSPPKFRRFLIDPSSTQDEQTQSTRFVYITNILSPKDQKQQERIEKTLDNMLLQRKDIFTKTKNSTLSLEGYNLIANDLVKDMVRNLICPYLSGEFKEVEVWLPNISNKKRKDKMMSWKILLQYIYVGFRSVKDTQVLMENLQGSQVQLPLLEKGLVTGGLFLDWADVTHRYNRDNTDDDGKNSKYNARKKRSNVKGESSRSECTSTTSHVEIPKGLVLIKDFVSQKEEDILMAVLTGPQAPWAPSQKRMGGTEQVKRRVQHYGYVFDYDTADVIRDRTIKTQIGSNGGACPPIPAIDVHKINDTSDLNENEKITNEQLKTFLDTAVKELNGWEVFAAIVEKTRRTDFRESLTFPNLNQITLNEYPPGQGIGSHVDTPSAFSDGLISISLNSGCVMEFRRQNEGQKERKLIYLPPRSLLLMSGPARYEWEHMIVNRRTDTVDGVVIPRKLRVSLTLRTAIDLGDPPKPLQRVESHSFPPRWNVSSTNKEDEANKNNQSSSSINAKKTPECEKQHVHAFYDAVAQQWHHTRSKRGVLWPGATKFLEALPQGSIVADVGCGDGKYFAAGWMSGCFVLGSDISLPLLQTALGGTDGGADPRQVQYDQSGASARPAVLVADCMNLPFLQNSCDAAICIAVMHHLSSEERRLQCLLELKRVVKNEGKIMVQAWALEQDKKNKRQFAGTDIFVPFNAQPKYLNKVSQPKNEKEPIQESNDGEHSKVPKSAAEVYSNAYDGADFDETKGLVVFKRYCHLYRYGELEYLVNQVDGLNMIEAGYESGNHYVLLQVTKS